MTIILRGYISDKFNGKQKYVDYLYKKGDVQHLFHNWNFLNFLYPKSTYLFKKWDIYILYSLKIFIYFLYLKSLKKNFQVVIDSYENLFLVDILSIFRVKDISLIFYDFASPKRELSNLDIRRIRKMKAIIVMTKVMKKVLIEKVTTLDSQIVQVKHYKINKSHFCPMSVDNIRNFKRLHGLPNNYLLYVGSEQDRKNFFTLINMFKDLLKDFPDYFFIKIGKDQSVKNRRKLKGILLSNKTISKNFILIDECSEDDLCGYYNGAHVFLFPSSYEGFGIPLTEAMACGIPIIASRIDTTVEVCSNSVLYVDDFYDSREFYTRAKEVIINKQLEIKLRAKSLERSKSFSY